MAAEYNPRDDSSPHAAWPPKVQSDRTPALVLVGGAGLCNCGCGEATVGAKALFRPGHDQRLKGRLVRAHRAGVGVVAVHDGKVTRMSAADLAGRLSWEKVLEAADRRQGDRESVAGARAEARQERAQKRAAAAPAQKKARAAGAAKRATKTPAK